MTEIIVDIFEWLIDFLGTVLFDQLALPIEFYSNLEFYIYQLMDFIGGIAFLVPVLDIFICLGIIITMRMALFSVYAFNWVIRRVADFFP